MNKLYFSLLTLFVILTLSNSCKKKEPEPDNSINGAEILSVFPDSAKGGDTIIIRGRKLGGKKAQVQLYGRDKSVLKNLWVSDTMLKVKNILSYEEGMYLIDVDNGIYHLAKEMPYKIYRPKLKILNLYQKSYEIGKIMKVALEGMTRDQDNRIEFINGNVIGRAEIQKNYLRADTNIFLITVPDLQEGDYYLRIYSRNQTVVSDKPLSLIYPTVKISMGWKTVHAGATFEIFGEVFNPDKDKNIVTIFNNGRSYTLPVKNVKVLEYGSKLWLTIPEEIFPQAYGVTLQTFNQTVKGDHNHGVNVIPNPTAPSILKVSQTTISREKTITLTGERLKGNSNTNVKFVKWPTESSFEIVQGQPSADGTSLNVTIPNSLTPGTYEIRVEVDGKYGFLKEIILVE